MLTLSLLYNHCCHAGIKLSGIKVKVNQLQRHRRLELDKKIRRKVDY